MKCWRCGKETGSLARQLCEDCRLKERVNREWDDARWAIGHKFSQKTFSLEYIYVKDDEIEESNLEMEAKDE